MNPFEEQIRETGKEGLFSRGIDIIQVNLGLRCNLACSHCHLGAGPDRKENMGWGTMEKILDIADQVRPVLVDLTGGSPELNPHLKDFIKALSGKDLCVQLRTNLTALAEPGSEGLMEFFRDHGVRLTGSLPCYLEENVRAQRGEGVFAASIKAIRRLNRLGYGTGGGLPLDLVYNPGKDYLPAGQGCLEADYRRELDGRFGVTFTNLLTITNMPIGRFRDILVRKNRYEKYIRLLKDSYNPHTLQGLMCLRQISIGWDGSLYDCDFNLALNLSMNHGAPDHIDRWDLESVRGRRIITGEHCLGCTAGCGSSCGGAIAERQG